MSDFNEIWPADEGSGKLTDEQLLAYLEGDLTEADRHAVEALLAGEGMESDAVEGLHGLAANEAKSIKARLNADLQRTLSKKRRGRRGLAPQRWNVLSVVILLLLILVCFAVFWLIRHKG